LRPPPRPTLFPYTTLFRSSRDKLYSLQLLLRHGISIPTSGFADSPMETAELVDMVNGAPLVVKLFEGPQGRGVVLAETRKAGERDRKSTRLNSSHVKISYA